MSETKHYHGHRERLRTRLLDSKKGTLPDYEILEILLFVAKPRGDVKPLAKELIAHFKTLGRVLTATPAQLREIKGVNEAVIASLRTVQEAAERLLKEEVKEQPILQSWKALLDYCRASMGYNKTEQFRILFLDRKNMLIADDLQEVGTVDQTPAYPREIVKRALQLDASAVILVHNHPSGDTTPSRADIVLTKQIADALKIVSVILHDHIIISTSEHYSFKSYGVI